VALVDGDRLAEQELGDLLGLVGGLAPDWGYLDRAGGDARRGRPRPYAVRRRR
jgi:hypothetical protein